MRRSSALTAEKKHSGQKLTFFDSEARSSLLFGNLISSTPQSDGFQNRQICDFWNGSAASLKEVLSNSFQFLDLPLESPNTRRFTNSFYFYNRRVQSLLMESRPSEIQSLFSSHITVLLCSTPFCFYCLQRRLFNFTILFFATTSTRSPRMNLWQRTSRAARLFAGPSLYFKNLIYIWQIFICY